MNDFNYKRLSPFKKFVVQTFPFIEADFDAITEYGLYCKIVDKLNETINNMNIVGTQMEEVTNAMTALQNYVNNYFENLDVQDEINNKLNEMVEEGTLQEIIADYLNSKAVFGFDNVESMKGATNLINGSYATTLGYHTKNDGGKAYYKIRNITNEDIIDEMFIIALNDENLIAELIFDDELNIKSVGAYGNNINNDTVVFNKAIEHLFNTKQGTIYIPNGNYKLDKIELLPSISLVGESQNKTILIPSISSSTKFMYMIKNPINYTNYKKFSILNLNNVNNLIAIDLTSIPSESSPYNGGIWYSKFSEITVSGFLIGMKLEAIDDQGDEANQFLNFEKVNIFRKGLDDNERCMIINQQLGQTVFDSCLFESTNLQNNGLALGINVDIGSTLSIGDSDIACLLFNNCTFQNSLKNIKINARGVTIRDSWFENIGQNIELLANSNLNLYNNRFANACYDGNGTGYVVKTGIQCYLKCYDNVIAGVRSENFILGNRNTNMILIKNNSTSAIPSSQITQQFGVDNNNSISTRAHNLVFIGASDTELKTINSTLSQGEELTIMVGGGASDGKSLKITSGGNITIRNNSPIILHNSDSITLTKQDILGVGWWVKSVHKFRYYSNTIPSSNIDFANTYFLAGDIIYNSNKTTGQPIGWECITSGTPGVWLPFGNFN